MVVKAESFTAGNALGEHGVLLRRSRRRDLEIKAVLGGRSNAENVGVTMVRTNLWVQGVLVAFGFRTGLEFVPRGWDLLGSGEGWFSVRPKLQAG